MTKKLGVSRASIRHAIQHLLAIGILESFQGKGTYVKVLPIKEIQEKMNMLYMNSEIKQLIEFRRILEVEACRLVVGRLTDKNLKNLKKYLDCMIENESNRDRFIKCDMAFHDEILAATENKIIMKSMEFVREEIEKQHRQFNTAIAVSAAIRNHTKILKALKMRNGENASKYMANHLDLVADAYKLIDNN